MSDLGKLERTFVIIIVGTNNMDKVFLTLLIVFTACGLVNANETIVGKWKGGNPEDGVLIFKKNGEFDIIDKNGESAFKSENKFTIKYEIIAELEPNQLYLNFLHENSTHRIPFGIFKIENGRLFLRESIEYHRSYGGFDMGVSRYEMPKDFSGIVKVFVMVK